MKRSHWVLVLTLALVTLMLAPTASADSPGKVEVCHQTASDAGGVPEWRLLSVSVKSLEQHVEHGDAIPGDEVPGSNDGARFDETCGVPVEGGEPGGEEPGGDEPGGEDPGNPGDPGSETVFAIAYSDLNQSGSYDSAVDVLIAKFIDGSGDGVPGAGDLIVTDRYPLEFGLGAFGQFGVTEHIATGATWTSTRCQVSTSAGTIAWNSSETVENYEERATMGMLSLFVDAQSSGVSDGIMATLGSPSQPMTGQTVTAPGSGDDLFLEIEVDCS